MSMVADPSKLDPKNAGGLDAHTKRIEKVLELLNASDRYDAAFLATIRYEKKVTDSFAGLFDKAIHLVTSHEAIRTEPLNLNFVFSGPEEWMTQWAYLYSRLPYILLYAAELVEHVFSTFENRTDPDYLADIQRRLDAATVLWGRTIEEPYMEMELKRLIEHSHSRLAKQYEAQGFGKPSRRDLRRMVNSGEFPRRTR